MVSGVLLIIPVLVLVAVGVGLSVFLDVAFSRKTGRNGRRPLPLLSGNELHDWAASEGRALTRELLETHSGRRDGVLLAQTASSFADEVLSQTWHVFRPHAPGLNCRTGNTEVPRVTMPEALSIVEELRQRGPAEFDAVRARARMNLAAQSARPQCPLRTVAGTCACALSRPLACSGRCLTGCDQPPADAGWGRTLGEGLMTGMQDELRSAGLDDNRYELNEVLARLPDVPNAGARWRHGDHLLAKTAVS